MWADQHWQHFTGPRRGDVFAESTFAKQIAMIEHDMIEPVVKVGNLDSLRTIADVRDAVRAYHEAAMGSWTRSRQRETQRTLFSSARATVCSPAKVNGVWPSSDAWLRAAL